MAMQPKGCLRKATGSKGHTAHDSQLPNEAKLLFTDTSPVLPHGRTASDP
jgi:hypothetical protein